MSTPPRGSRRTDTPEPVAVNLDTMEREGAPPPAFPVVLNGKRYVFKDAMEVDWQQLSAAMRSGDDYQFLVLVLSGEDYAEFLEQKLPTWKLRNMVALYRKHYHLDVAPGE